MCSSLLGGRFLNFPVCPDFSCLMNQLPINLAHPSMLPWCCKKENLKRIFWKHKKTKIQTRWIQSFSRLQNFIFTCKTEWGFPVFLFSFTAVFVTGVASWVVVTWHVIMSVLTRGGTLGDTNVLTCHKIFGKKNPKKGHLDGQQDQQVTAQGLLRLLCVCCGMGRIWLISWQTFMENFLWREAGSSALPEVCFN